MTLYSVTSALYYYIDRTAALKNNVHLLVHNDDLDIHLSGVSQETFAGFQKSVRVLPTADVEVERAVELGDAINST